MSRSTTTRPTRASSARDPVTRASSARDPATRASSARRAAARAARATGALLLAAGLTACIGYGPGPLGPGASEAQVRERMGVPTLTAALPGGGTRLDYGRGPFGKHTYRVEVDASGRVQRIEQLLNERNFEALPPRIGPAEVLDRLGPPSERRGGWRGLGEVWSYRFEDWFVPCRWFQVWLVDGRVREAGYSTDPMCEEPSLRDE